MNVNDQLLLAYIDGALAPDLRGEVEAAIAHSPELASQAFALQASRLPYQAAFNQQKLPPMPERLRRSVDELVSVSGRAPASASKPSMPRPRWQAGAWLAAAFFAGAIFHTVLMSSGIPTGGMDPWVQAVVSYQDLYIRDTVVNVREDRNVTEALLADIRLRDGIPVQIPDLRSAGLEFKRIQRLSYQNKPLIQIVYLPERGEPVALCIFGETKPDAAIKSQRVDQMTTVTWRRNGLAYVLLGKDSKADLKKIGETLAT